MMMVIGLRFGAGAYVGGRRYQYLMNINSGIAISSGNSTSRGVGGRGTNTSSTRTGVGGVRMALPPDPDRARSTPVRGTVAHHLFVYLLLFVAMLVREKKKKQQSSKVVGCSKEQNSLERKAKRSRGEDAKGMGELTG